MWDRGGCEEGVEDRSNLKSDPPEHEREVGEVVVVVVAEEASTVGKWWCGGGDSCGAEQGARWAWRPAKEAEEEGKKGAEEAC